MDPFTISNEEKRKTAFEFLSKHKEIKLLKVVWVDLANVIRCKSVRTKWLLENDFEYVCVTSACMALRIFDDCIVSGAMSSSQFSEVFLVPDWGTIRVVSFLDGIASVFGSFYTSEGIATESSTPPLPLATEHAGTSSIAVNGLKPWPLCPRHALYRAMSTLASISPRSPSSGEISGLQLKGSFEEEFYLLPKLACELPATASDPYTFASVMSLNQYQPVLNEIAEHLELQGVPIEQILSESGPGQFEMTVPYTSILEACDRHTIFRETVHYIAGKHNLQASFLPKVYLDRAGNGCHVHLSLWDPRTNQNLVPHAADPVGVSEIAKRAIAGILAHAKGMTPILNANVNSYHRLQPNCWSGGSITWGLDNKEAMVRVPSSASKPTKGCSNFEVKTLDHTTNPYLAISALICAMVDGLTNETISVPPATSINPSSLTADARANLKIDNLPTSLRDALSELERDQTLCKMLGTSISKAYIAQRTDEMNHVKGLSHQSLIERYYKLY